MDDASGRGAATSAATLTELAEKLSTLRDHLDRVVAELNARRGGNGDLRETTVVSAFRRGSRNSARTDGRLRCHECGRTGSHDAAGWTLRLCGDDELHPFCRECDSRYFNGNGG